MSNLPRRKRLPSLNALRALEAAARHLSFKSAADELNVSQSAISHQVKAPEENLDAHLFVRRTRAVELTSQGKMTVLLNKWFPKFMDKMVYNHFAKEPDSPLK